MVSLHTNTESTRENVEQTKEQSNKEQRKKEQSGLSAYKQRKYLRKQGKVAEAHT